MKHSCVTDQNSPIVFWNAAYRWCLIIVLFASTAIISGCGAGGYAGNALPAFVASRVTIDGGQAIALSLSNPGNLPVQWNLSGTACSESTCGALSSGSNTSVTFTAPQVTSQLTVTAKASLTATSVTTTTTIVVNPAPKITGVTPVGTVGVAYSATLVASGGTGTLKWNAVKGSLPAGLSFNASTGVISGTPTAVGTSDFMAEVVDQSDLPFTLDTPEQITIGTASAVLTASGNPPTGVVGTAYAAALQAAGGTAPYSWSVFSGSLPTGLSLSTAGVISGTPTTVGNYTFAAQVRDAANTTANVQATITVSSSAAPLTITTSTLPDGTVGTLYSSTVGVSGGTSPYTCTVISGSLPAGLSFGAGCAVTGTPTIAGTSTPVIRVTDASSPAVSVTGPVVIVIHPAAVVITIASPPPATANTPYTGLIPITGGTGPYNCSLVSGTLPAGLTLNANCQITGTPTTVSVTTITVKVTDSSSPTQTNNGPVTITVNPGGTTLTLGTPPVATVNTPYTGLIPVTGGTAPYTCTVVSGSLPAGLTMGANCTISGTPTTAGTITVTITVVDSASPMNTKTGPVTITVQPIATLTLTGSLPNATVNVTYTQTLHANGGLAPYTYAITAGSLPAGLSLSTAGVISGTPTAVGASSFTVTATDSEGTPQTASLPLVLLVVYQDTPYNGLLKGPYAFLFQGYDDVVAGVLAYQTSTIGAFTSNGAGVLTAGELDSNHQTSNPAGNTIADASLVGTYTLGADGRGTIAVSTLNTNGAVAGTTTYAIALKLPTAPATVATSGSLIQADGNALVGTKGSGALLAQTSSAFATGLTGSYAFGLGGDTPCLPSCTLGLIAGPVATVGQFTANGGALSGMGDATIASTTYASSTLAGSYAAADGNGRVPVSLTASKLASLPYPTDFAVYMVDASHAFVMSTDKHSAYILQAGTATLQTQTTFSNASLNAPYVGYENAAVNPGIVGTTLGNVLNLSSATIFRGTGNNNGTCTTTNVDVGGLTGLVSSLTGLGSNSSIVNALLGTYQSLGNSNCTVANNGRAVLDYASPNTILSATLGLLGLGNTPPPARVVYLTSPNVGYFLETGYAGLGKLEAQTGAPFTVASLNGSYVYGSIPASSLATINGTGSFTADGAGHATTTTDQNVGVGTINVLQLGVTSSANYSLTDAAAGRYLLGGTRVVYAITPGRYVLLETNALSTSPYIALLF